MTDRAVIIGGGAAGLMAAIAAARRGINVIVLERNDRPARKVMITGKGRCNVTNNTGTDGLMKAVRTNGRFLYSAYSQFSSQDTMDFFEKAGVPLKTERGNRVFPCSDKAVDIVDALVNTAKAGGVKFIKGRAVELLISDGKINGVITEDGRTISASAVLISTGGMSYPLTGSDGDGYTLAKQAGHTVTDLKPSLVPLVVHEGWCSELQGLSLKNVEVRIYCQGNKNPVFKDFGEMIFTHFGVSGPIILSASAYLKNPESGQYSIHIDLKPALSEEVLDKRLINDFNENLNRDFRNSLDALLPKKLIPVIVRLSNIQPYTKVNQITREQRTAFVSLLKDLTLTVTDFRPIEEAIVTSGGVSVKEINPSTMESKFIRGLFFAGEVIDLDAFTGGFNLQIAFSTGNLAGLHILEE